MKLFVLDLMNLAFRAYYGGTKNLTRSDGQPTSVVFGMALAITALLREHSPDYVIVAADSKGKTFRHDMYAGYKANRNVAPDDFSIQLPAVLNLIDSFGFKTVRIPGVEADDLIASIAYKFSGFTKSTAYYGNLVGQEPQHIGTADEVMQVVIVSSDKDCMQMINDNVSMLKPLNGGGYEPISYAGVLKKFDVGPSQVIDCQALIGDAVDCVPGVKGIGEKTAAKLIKSYGTLEGVYANLHLIPSKMAQKLHAEKEMAFLSKSLVTMKKDIPIDVTLDEIRVSKNIFNQAKLQEFYKEYEFFSLMNVSTD